LIDPVDGFDPFGIVKNTFITNPPKQLPFYTPTLIVSTGLVFKGDFILFNKKN